MTEPEAAVAILRSPAPAECVLLIRRAEREEDSWSGHWSFPGGRRDPEDRDPLHTALRELDEECGIRLSLEHVETALPHVWARRKTGPFVLVAPFLFQVDGELATELDPREAAESLWVPLALLRDPVRHRLRTVPGRPKEMLYPGIDLNGVPLWGFTYRLITDWLGLTPEHRAVEKAGFEAACTVLDFLMSHGLTLDEGWVDRSAVQGADSRQVVKEAAVKGAIPVAAVLEHFARPGRHVLAVNCLEVRSDGIRLTGPAYQDYFIKGSA